MHKKKLPVLLLMALLINSIVAQTLDALPENKYKDNSDSRYTMICDYFGSKKVGINIFNFRSSFTNSNFASSIANGTLFYDDYLYQPMYRLLNSGFEISGRVNLAPILIDLGYFSDRYYMLNGERNWDNRHIYKLNGLKLSVSTLILPITKYLLPYGGVGYQFSKIGFDTPTTSYSDTSSPFWKIGCQSYLFNHFPITFEYSQTFLNPSKSANQITFGIGYSL